MAFWKESMINQLSNLINRNRLAAKISQVLCSNAYMAKGIINLQAIVTVKDFDASIGFNTLKKKNRVPGHLCGSTALRGKE